MRNYLCAITFLFISACAPDGTTQSAEYETLAVDNELIQALEGNGLGYRGGLVLTSGENRFGGWSGLEIEDGGSGLIAISDVGVWMNGQLAWSDRNELVGIHSIETYPLVGRHGEPLYGEASDAEALAALGDGRYAVSFERFHRLNIYQPPLSDGAERMPAIPLDAPPRLGTPMNNQGLTGLTALSAGRLLAAVEGPEGHMGPRQLWLLDRGQWTALSLEGHAGFALTGLSAAGDRIYGLERHYSPEDGVSVHLISFEESQLRPGTPVTPHLIATLDSGSLVENFEAVSVIDRNGERILILLSDSNFNADQRTLLLAFSLGQTP